MKVKASPEDFRVEEQSSVELSDRPAPYAVYRLEKASWDTFDLLDLLARRLGVERHDITVAGIKDRHGSTSQLVAVRGLAGRPREVREANFSAVPAGWTDAPLSARSITGNRFSLVLRDMDRPEVRRRLENLEAVRRDGLPNYYDEQRFGSARHGGGFMGKELFLGHRERALRLFFTASKHDDRRTREMKRCVLENWGGWRACLPLARGDYARVLERLAASPRAFRQAILALDRRFLVLVLNAYQSFLFNEVLAGLTSAARPAATASGRQRCATASAPSSSPSRSERKRARGWAAAGCRCRATTPWPPTTMCGKNWTGCSPARGSVSRTFGPGSCRASACTAFRAPAGCGLRTSRRGNPSTTSGTPGSSPSRSPSRCRGAATRRSW